MKYLITGSAGFIGFHLAQRLLDEGHGVTGFDAITPYYDVTLKEARNGLLARHSAFTATTTEQARRSETACSISASVRTTT